jgi:hypothetical protein
MKKTIRYGAMGTIDCLSYTYNHNPLFYSNPKIYSFLKQNTTAGRSNTSKFCQKKSKPSIHQMNGWREKKKIHPLSHKTFIKFP